jgi:hypothetical protein
MQISDRHVLRECICIDDEGSSFTGLRGILTQAQLDILNKNARENGITRRWAFVNETDSSNSGQISI